MRTKVWSGDRSMTSVSFSAGATETARNNGFGKKLSEIVSMDDCLCMEQDGSRPGARFTQDELYLQASEAFGAALERLARAYEVDSEKRRDLLQEIHMAIWRSFESYASLCSLRTWVYRVAHNTATSYVLRQRRRRKAAPNDGYGSLSVLGQANADHFADWVALPVVRSVAHGPEPNTASIRVVRRVKSAAVTAVSQFYLDVMADQLFDVLHVHGAPAGL